MRDNRASASAKGDPVSPSGAERSEAVLGTTKEVLGFIDFLDFNWNFLGFPILL